MIRRRPSGSFGSPRRAVKDDLYEARLFRSRAWIAFFLVLAVCVVLALRFTNLQWAQHETFVTASEANRIKLRPLPPPRGLVFDRFGEILADNQPAYRIEVVREQVQDMATMLPELAQLLNMSQEELDRFTSLSGARRAFESVPLKLRVTEQEVARFAVNRHRFPGVDVVPYLTRVYPTGSATAHVVGYVGRIDADDLRELAASRYSATSHTGKTGIEKRFESRLHGQVGYERVEVNAEGRTLNVVERVPAIPGKDIHLTLDLGLQQAAIAALDGRPGAVVAVEPETGDVLALVSEPAFDPQWFVDGISQKRYSALLENPNRPLFNRAIAGGYEPGSTLKPFIALAAFASGTVPLDYQVVSTGNFRLPGQKRPYRDWRRGGHGRVGVVEALAQSVNTWFYDVAAQMGIDQIHDQLAPFGFGQPTGIELPGESTGLLPSVAWKSRQIGEPWYPGETVIAGIGQGFMMVTPAQLAGAVSILANRGWRMPLHLEGPPGTDPGKVTASPTAWQRVVAGMQAVVQSSTGTARAVGNNAPYSFAGKTGTAQVFGLAEGEEYEADEVPEHLRHNALFIAFAPVEKPRIALALVVEHGGGGSSTAAPVARQILDYYLLRDTLTQMASGLRAL